MRHQFHRAVVGLNEMTEVKGALYILLIIMMYFVLTVYYSINSASLYMPCLRVASNNSAIRKRVHETRICEAFILLLLSQMLPSLTLYLLLLQVASKGINICGTAGFATPSCIYLALYGIIGFHCCQNEFMLC